MLSACRKEMSKQLIRDVRDQSTNQHCCLGVSTCLGEPSIKQLTCLYRQNDVSARQSPTKSSRLSIWIAQVFKFAVLSV